MANMYGKSVNFNSPEELADYVDWVAKENGIDHKTALAAIAKAGQATIQGKKIDDWEPVDEKVWQQIIPELKPVVGEAGYEAPKSFGETLGSTIAEGVIDDITGYPKRKFWELATGGYFNGDKINTKKILDDAGVGKKGNKKTDIKTDNKGEEKKSSGLLKFGKEATSIQQIENRDKQLAQILSDKGVTDISKVKQFLNKFDTFKDAPNEDKQRTINRIINNINNININKQEDKQEYKQDTKKEIPVSSKKEEVKLLKPGSNWLPDDYSSINGVEEEKDDTLIYDKKGNPVGSKIKETKKQDTKKQETKSNDNKGKKLNIVKGSETIKNLLKNSKK